jgi:hypothetical protein
LPESGASVLGSGVVWASVAAVFVPSNGRACDWLEPSAMAGFGVPVFGSASWVVQPASNKYDKTTRQVTSNLLLLFIMDTPGKCNRNRQKNAAKNVCKRYFRTTPVLLSEQPKV